MKYLLALCALLSFSALAENSNWSLVKKIAGPSVFKCPEHVLVVDQGSSLSLQGGDIRLSFEDLNQGAKCGSRYQTGSIFGTVTCKSFAKVSSAAQIEYSEKNCSTDLPFVTSCRPKVVINQVKIIADKTLHLIQKTGWQGDDTFECLYTLER